MGVTFSTPVQTGPVFFAGTIIGFISFAFTVATWLRVFWENINTIFAAETEIHAYLSNLRVELYEERASLRQLRRHNREFGHSTHGKAKGRSVCRLDDVTLKSLNDIVRRLTRRFKRLEQPFLGHNDAAGRRRPRENGYPYARESGSWEDDTKGGRKEGGRKSRHVDEDDDEDDDDIAGNHYCNITLAKRFVWLRRRSEAISLTESLSRVQTRRIARQVGEITVALYQYGAMVEDIRDDLEDVTGRLNRVVGIRRVD